MNPYAAPRFLDIGGRQPSGSALSTPKLTPTFELPCQPTPMRRNGRKLAKNHARAFGDQKLRRFRAAIINLDGALMGCSSAIAECKDMCAELIPAIRFLGGENSGVAGWFPDRQQCRRGSCNSVLGRWPSALTAC